MRVPNLVAVAGLAWLLGANAADADELGSAVHPPAAACDFFQAQLIGLLCGGTGYVAPEIGGGNLTRNRTSFSPPHNGFGGITRTDHWDDRQTYEDATVAVSPWQGVRFHVTGEAFQYNDRDSTVIRRGLGESSSVSKWSGAYGGWQTFGVEATIMDRQTETGRYVLNLIGGAGYFAGGGVYQGRDRQRIGWESGAQWRLGGSGYSVDYFSQTLFERFDNPGELRVESSSRLLIASDAYSVALGPLLNGQSELWHAAGYNTGWSEARLGAMALAAPFRATQIPVLRDMTVEASATHTLGQAALIPVWAGKSSAYDYAASARFNFRY
jgi:hypothetical protein